MSAWLLQLSTVGKTMSGVWLALIPPVLMLAGLFIALPLWLRKGSWIGNILGAGIISVGMLALIGHEYEGLRHFRATCVARRGGCITRPDDFTRYSIYAGVGFADIAALFMTGLYIEEWRRRKLNEVRS